MFGFDTMLKEETTRRYFDNEIHVFPELVLITSSEFELRRILFRVFLKGQKSRENVNLRCG